MLPSLTTIPKRFLLLVGIGLLFFILLIVLLVQSFTGERQSQEALPSVLPTPQIALPPNITKSTLRNIRFQLQDSNLPNEALVYKVTNYDVDRAWAETIANTFGFLAQPSTDTDVENNTIVSWQSPDGLRSLIVTLELGYLEYFENTPSSTTNPSLTSAQQAIPVAENYLKQHKLFPPGVIANQQVDLFTDAGGELEETNSFSQATILKVSFSRRLGGKSVVGQFANQTVIAVWVDKAGHVKRLIYQYPIVVENSAKSYPLVGLEEAKRQLQQGQGTIVNYVPGEDDPKQSGDPSSVTLTKVSLGYFDDRQTAVIQPIYIFEGVGVYPRTGTQEVIVYLPAVRSQ